MTPRAVVQAVLDYCDYQGINPEFAGEFAGWYEEQASDGDLPIPGALDTYLAIRGIKLQYILGE